MTRDMFIAPDTSIRLPLDGADVVYWPCADLGEPPDLIVQALLEATPWRAEKIVLWGKSYMQPRLIAWYGDEDSAYTYSGLRLEPLPWTPRLQALRTHVEALCGHRFNSVLLNYYRDHRDGMGFHSDDEPELGPQPVIASVTLGEPRPFSFKHKRDRSRPVYRMTPESGSVLLMRGDTQKNWKHGLEKLTQPCGPRLNLTFRQVHPPTG